MNLCTSSRCPLSLRPSLAYASTRFLILDGRNQLHRDHRVIIECKPIKIEEPLRFRHFHRNLRHYPHLARISQGYSVHFRTIEFGEPLKDHRKSMKIIETKIARICRRFIISLFLHFSWVSQWGPHRDWPWFLQLDSTTRFPVRLCEWRCWRSECILSLGMW